jgi:hypothetical protein
VELSSCDRFDVGFQARDIAWYQKSSANACIAEMSAAIATPALHHSLAGQGARMLASCVNPLDACF